MALCRATANLRNVTVYRFHEQIEQDPNAPGFWEMWRDILISYGFMPGDYIVASEDYGVKLAKVCLGRFMPYDIDREIYYSHGKDIRNDPGEYFDQILPEFQHHLRQTVTLFGAESTGKTTLSRDLADAFGGEAWWTPEWARPYLETVGTEITTASMTAIWEGQRALQESMLFAYDRPVLIQDTDLFSTVGYWDFWDMNTPKGLVDDAIQLKSNLYLITQSNIPFEQDPIRYGGDKRESDDQYWIDLCERFGLNYYVVKSNSREARVRECVDVIRDHWLESAKSLQYKRFED